MNSETKAIVIIKTPIQAYKVRMECPHSCFIFTDRGVIKSENYIFTEDVAVGQQRTYCPNCRANLFVDLN